MYCMGRPFSSNGQVRIHSSHLDIEQHLVSLSCLLFFQFVLAQSIPINISCVLAQPQPTTRFLAFCSSCSLNRRLAKRSSRRLVSRVSHGLAFSLSPRLSYFV